MLWSELRGEAPLDFTSTVIGDAIGTLDVNMSGCEWSVRYVISRWGSIPTSHDVSRNHLYTELMHLSFLYSRGLVPCSAIIRRHLQIHEPLGNSSNAETISTSIATSQARLVYQ